MPHKVEVRAIQALASHFPSPSSTRTLSCCGYPRAQSARQAWAQPSLCYPRAWPHLPLHHLQGLGPAVAYLVALAMTVEMPLVSLHWALAWRAAVGC